MNIGTLVNRLLFAGVLLAGPLITGCEEDDDDDEHQYVSPGTADVRGTWYDDGLSGGWFGPDDTWGFEWYYFEQYGTNIEGRTDYELYDQNNGYDELDRVFGTVQGNSLYLTILDWEGDVWSTVRANVNGDALSGTEYRPDYSIDFELERTSSNIVRFATPW